MQISIKSERKEEKVVLLHRRKTKTIDYDYDLR
jgi:hypothetical protein